MIKKVLYVFALTSCFTGCRQEDPTPTRTQLLTTKRWYVKSYLVTTPGTPTQDIYPLVPICQQDDFEQFVVPDNFIYDEGLTKCSSTDPQTQSGTWLLTDNDRQLTTTYNGRSRIYIIAELTDNSLKLTTSESNSNGQFITYDISFTTH